ncbi:MAG: hypothetical protein PUG09_02610 [Prevotella sp.]|nr:hypothetical protein [Prevotella sp.]
MKLNTLLTTALFWLFASGTAMSQSYAARSPQTARLGSKPHMLRAASPSKTMAGYEWPKTVLTETPAGELSSGLSKSMSYFSYDGASVNYATSNCSVGALVKGTDGNYYLSEPISQLYSPSWLKLQVLKGDTLVARFPQAVYSEQNDEGAEVLYYAFPMTKYMVDDGWGGTTPFLKLDTLADGKTVKDSIRFVLRNDSLLQLGDDFIGLVNDDLLWAGYGDGNIVLNKIKSPKYQPSADELALAHDYLMRTGDADTAYDWQVVKAIVGAENVYVRNPYNNRDDQWIKGTLNGSKVHFDSNQYFGVDSAFYLHLYAMTSNYTLHEETDPTYGTNTSYNTFTFNPGFDMDFDAGSKSFGVSQAVADSVAWLINAGNTVPYFTASYIRPYFTPYTEVPATPEAPQFQANQCVAYSADNGYGYITFHYSKFDDKHNYLNAGKYFYRVYLKASKDASPELFTFSPDTYFSLKTDQTEIPVQFADRSDFYTVNGSKDGEPTRAWASFNTYTNDFYAIGVQLVYKGGGQEGVTDIKWWSFVNTGVKGVKDSKKVSGTDYYDLNGCRISRPRTGVSLKVTHFSDGSSKVEKLVNVR